MSCLRYSCRGSVTVVFEFVRPFVRTVRMLEEAEAVGRVKIGLGDTLPAMPNEHERKEIALEYCRRVSAGETERIVELFAPTATIEDPIGSGPVTGHDALREFYGDIIERFGSEVEPGVPRASYEGTSVALPIMVQARMDGQAREIASVDVFEIDDAGKISRMWAYWGPSDIS